MFDKTCCWRIILKRTYICTDIDIMYVYNVYKYIRVRSISVPLA